MAVRLPNYEVIFLPELLRLVNNELDPLSQRDYLYQYYNKDEVHANILQQFMELIIHPDVVWELPQGVPHYQPASGLMGESPSSLFTTFRECSRFLKDGGGFVQDKDKRELYFITTLESLSKDEAELLCQIKDRNLTTYPNVDLRVFVEAFPEFLPSEVVADFLEKKFQPVSSKTSTSNSTDTAKKAGRPRKDA